MICATILLCYLFTCCTHLVTLASTNQPTSSSLTQTQAQIHTTTGNAAAATHPHQLVAAASAPTPAKGATTSSINWNNKDEIRIEDLRHDNVHRLMSEKDLRSTFQVDSHDQVPEYEILISRVRDDGSHLISPISDLGELIHETTTTTTKQTTLTKSPPKNDNSKQLEQVNFNHHQKPSSTYFSAATSTFNSQANGGKSTISNELEASTIKTSQSLTRHKRSSSSTSLESWSTSSLAKNKGNGNRNSERTNSNLNSNGVESSVDKEEEKEEDNLRRKRRSRLSDTVAQEAGAKKAAAAATSGFNEEINNDATAEDNKLIVMNLSTFGKDFKLRLKRNADFQQRIKDMKMFMAESTKDGQLRYTEIKSHHHHPSTTNNNHHHHHHHEQRKQEPHKREADATVAADEPIEADESPSSSSGGSSSSPSAAASTKEASGGKKKKTTKNTDSVWNIGSTYHDEDNLAALLIDHDRKTGQLQVDGTIGNDFVIKPMPRATIEALIEKRKEQDLLRRQQQKEQQKEQKPTLATEQLASTSRLDRLAPIGTNNEATLGASGILGDGQVKQADYQLDLERSSSSNNSTSFKSSTSSNTKQQPLIINTSAIQHMHDDDPHDDDEMFLDEDEALELAHLQSAASIETNHTSNRVSAQNQTNLGSTHTNPIPQQLPQQQQQQQLANGNTGKPVRTLSKAASERKWKKYRKLMAQTQVPKPAQLAASSDGEGQIRQQQQTDSRSRRHLSEPMASNEPKVIQVSHHIIYRQKPSSEGSSSEHQHSFMVSPGDYMNSPASAASMEQLAVSFSPQRLTKRSASSSSAAAAAAAGTSHGSDSLSSEGNTIDDSTRQNDEMDEAATIVDADFLHDPLGGQFYLEPGSITGFERAGYSDWSFSGANGSGRRMAPPPYVLNGTSAQTGNETSFADYHNNNNNNGTNHRGQERRRFKRQTRGSPMASMSQVRRKRQAPDTVWPEVLLVVDYDSFLLHGGDSRDVKRYFVSFWNGVDLRYKLLVHPHIRISLAGMIVAKDRDATPYLERNRLRAPNADAVDAAGALTDMGKYLYREDRLPTYDLAVVITKLDMCRRRYEGGRCNRGTAGFAYVGGACVVNKRLEKVNSVAIIEDSGGFSGIIVAAHEVGHLLGCVHDGSPPPSYLGGPGATHCPWEDGFIMSDLRHTERGFRWSQCSVEQFKHFLNGETATCLYNYPHESQMLHRLLPGTMLSLDEQCKRDRGTNACFKDARVCAQLFCFDSASGYCVSYRPAAEGSPCGEGQVCRNGKCVGEIENIIPDYTHQSQTVVARQRPHSVARLADNGISASSTSTATSSPDNKLGTSNIVPQLTSRMDTFPVDTPINGAGALSSSSHPFGGRYPQSQATGGVGGVTVPVAPGTSAIAAHHQHHVPMKSANLIDFGGGSQVNFNNNNRRSGQQAIPKAGAMINHQYQHHYNNNQNNAKPYGSYQSNFSNNNNQNHHLNNHQSYAHGGGSTTSALYSSASTISQQIASSSSPSSHSTSSSTISGNNLLTSVSTNQAKAKNKQQQQQQQLHDNQQQRIMYQQPITTQEGGFNLNSNSNYNRNVNHHQPSSSSSAYANGPIASTSHRLYTSSFSPQTSVTTS